MLIPGQPATAETRATDSAGSSPRLTETDRAVCHASSPAAARTFAGGSSTARPSAPNGGGWHIVCPFHCWPHQQRPSASMMQVPLPQQRGSSVMLNFWSHFTKGRTVVKPPSTGITWPVKRAAPSPSSHAITSAT